MGIRYSKRFRARFSGWPRRARPPTRYRRRDHHQPKLVRADADHRKDIERDKAKRDQRMIRSKRYFQKEGHRAFRRQAKMKIEAERYEWVSEEMLRKEYCDRWWWD